MRHADILRMIVWTTWAEHHADYERDEWGWLLCMMVLNREQKTQTTELQGQALEKGGGGGSLNLNS